MKKINFLVFLFFIAFSSLSWSQTKVTGTVLDDTNTPLPGANVIVKTKKANVTTDFDGRFIIDAQIGDVLEVSFIGMKTQEFTVKNNSGIKISLKSDNNELDDVVVIGYGTKKKKDITGAVTSVKSEEFNKGIVTSPEQLIQGKVSGVNVTSASGEPGSTQTISIRGQGGIRTGSSPLYVIDGFALDNSTTGGSVNPLSFINSDDIESIDVLKDASATAIYGSRGANGVIIVTTKRGKSGKAQVSLSSTFSTSKIARELPVFGADEFREKVVALGGTLTDLKGDTDWQKQITRLAVTQNHNLTISGGADKLTYFASLGTLDQEGIIKDNNLKRISGRINLTQKSLDNKFKVDFNLSVANTNTQRPDTGSLIGNAISLNPTYPAYDATGNPSIFPEVENPLLTLNFYKDKTENNRIIASISPSYEIVKGLVYKLNYGLDISNSDQDIQSFPSTTPFKEGRLDSYYYKNENRLVENYITYSKNIGLHNFSVLGGQSYQKIETQTRHWSINKFADNGIDPAANPGLGQLLTYANNAPGGTAEISELQSFFGRLEYSFNSKYLFTGTFRADGSTKFGDNNKYGYFPSFAAGWIVSEEEFMKNSPFSNLKVRAGWGQTGNQEIPAKQTKASSTVSVTGTTSYPLDSSTNYIGGATYVRLANPNLQWEVSTQTNVGLDFGLFGGALTGTVDYFDKESSKVLMKVVSVDPIQPAANKYDNVPDMRIVNKGLELALDYKHKSTTGLSYGLGGNISFIDNKIKNLPYTVLTTGTASGSGLSSASINGYVSGEPIGTFYLKEFIGIDATTGMSNYRDVNNDGVVNDKDRIIAGTALPDKLFSFYGNLAYKGFDMSFNFNGVSGNKIYDNTANSNFYRAKLVKSVNTTSAATEFPNESNTNSASVSTRYLKDGAYLRLNNATLGYTFNTTNLGLSQWVKAMRLSVTGQNLFVITKYNGYDPEVNTDRSSEGVTSYGIDYVSYPKARTILMGLNVTF
ncbi:MAG: TonB-dependent receptor [Flavobacterium sp.]